jgi:hypothetical protein
MTSEPSLPRPFNVYFEPEAVQWLDSMEGVPAYVPPTLAPESLLTHEWQRRLHRVFEWCGQMAPGLMLAAGLAFAGAGVSTFVGTTLILQVGEKGKNVGVVGVYPDATPKLKFELVNLDKQRFQEDEAMRDVMREYQQMLQDLDVIGNSIPVGHPRETEFVGADACKSCHTLAYGVWVKSGHAHGVESLLKGGEDYAGDWIPRIHDPECIACHTAGWDPKRILRYKSGFVSIEKTPHLTGQQCENCHGPASRHVALETAWEKARATVNVDELAAARKAQHLDKDTAEKNVCSKCHDLDNSPKFNFEEYWEKIKHPGKS